MKFSCFFAWYDCWLGFYYDQKRKALYCCLIPCLVLKIQFTATSTHNQKLPSELLAPYEQANNNNARIAQAREAKIKKLEAQLKNMQALQRLIK